MRKEEAVAERLRKDWAFVAVPSVVLRDKEISDAEKITYQYLTDHAGSRGKCWVSQKRLAKDRGKSLRTIERHISRLKSLGLLEIIPGTPSSDTIIIDVSILYENPKVRYKQSERCVGTRAIREDERVKNVGIRPDKNDGSRPDKNDGYNREQLERRKPDTSYPGALPSGQALSSDDSSRTHRETNVAGFLEKAKELGFSFSEVQEMALSKPRHAQSKPEGMPDRSTKGKRGKMVDTEGNPEEAQKRSQKKPSKIKKKVHKLWNEWRWMIKGTFHVPVPGRLPTGSNYGHLKNLVNFSGGDEEYALQLLRYVVDRWEEVKSGNFRAERMNVPTLYLVDALKEEMHANIQTGQSFQPKPKGRESSKERWGVNRHSGNYDGWDEMAKREREEGQKTKGGDHRKEGV